MDGLTPEQAQGVRNLVAGLKQCGERLAQIQAEMTQTLTVAAALLVRLEMTAGPRE